MSSSMKEKLAEIRNIEDKYGPFLFRMGLTHLFDAGHRHMTEENVAASIEMIHAKEQENQAKGVKTVMTPHFQCEIVRCAAELAKFSISELFLYIKKHVVVSE
jgi:DNA transposition AAA+ family ATPase